MCSVSIARKYSHWRGGQVARAGNSFAGRRVLGWIPACAGMTDCGRVPDPLAKKQPMTFRSSFPTARGYAGPPEEANVIPAEAGIQSGWLGALSRSSRYTVRRPSGGRHSMTAARARRMPVVEWLTSACEGDVSRRTGTKTTFCLSRFMSAIQASPSRRLACRHNVRRVVGSPIISLNRCAVAGACPL